MSSRIPPLLEPYLYPGPSSLTLLTGVLGASPNWLVLRYLYSHLKTRPSQSSSADGYGRDHTGTPSRSSYSSSLEGINSVLGKTDAGDGEDGVGVVLVSFLRSGSFWREGAGRIGLDLDGMGRMGRFVFVDGLTELFGIEALSGETGAAAAGSSAATTALGGRERFVRSATGDAIRREVEGALGDLKAAKKVLIVDGLDAVLAISGGAVTSAGAQDVILRLREKVHSTILTASADDPLLHAQTTTIEKEHANWVLSTAHSADAIVALRMLDTGMARDVSGVVRITEGRGEGKEYLYYVGGDGGVRVFERGS